MPFEVNPNDPDHAELLALNAANQRRMNELAARGTPVNIEGRLEMLIDRVLGQKGKARFVFEQQWAQDVSDTLDQIESQIRQQMLLAGVHGASPNGVKT